MSGRRGKCWRRVNARFDSRFDATGDDVIFDVRAWHPGDKPAVSDKLEDDEEREDGRGEVVRLEADHGPDAAVAEIQDVVDGHCRRNAPSRLLKNSPTAWLPRERPRGDRYDSIATMCAWIFPSTVSAPNRCAIADVARSVALLRRAGPRASISPRSGPP